MKQEAPVKTPQEILKEEYGKLIVNPDKVYMQNPSIIKAAHSAIKLYHSQFPAARYREALSKIRAICVEDFTQGDSNNITAVMAQALQLNEMVTRILETLIEALSGEGERSFTLAEALEIWNAGCDWQNYHSNRYDNGKWSQDKQQYFKDKFGITIKE